MTETKIAIEDLRSEVRQAKQREKELAREVDALPGKIKEASRRVVSEKADQARAGGTLLAVAAESEIAELERRRQDIGYERWAAKLHRASLEASLHGAEEEMHAKSIPAAKAALDKANREAEDARQAKIAADAAYTGAERRQDEARRLRKAADDEIKTLEEEYPSV